MCLFKALVFILCVLVSKGKDLVCIFMRFSVSLDHFGSVLLVLLGLLFQYPVKRLAGNGLQNNLFCIEWDAKPWSIHAAPIKSMTL